MKRERALLSFSYLALIVGITSALLPKVASFQPIAVLPQVSAFHKNVHPFKSPAPTILYATPNKKGDNNGETVFYQYKDDCFGFLFFLCGVAVGDVVFTGVFVVLSIAAAAATRQKLLPPDTKRPSIVDRKIPAAVAALTLLLSSPAFSEPLMSAMSGALSVVMGGGLDIPDPDPIARPVQLAVGGFSVITWALDIRWRDRFDYPQDFMNK